MVEVLVTDITREEDRTMADDPRSIRQISGRPVSYHSEEDVPTADGGKRRVFWFIHLRRPGQPRHPDAVITVNNKNPKYVGGLVDFIMVLGPRVIILVALGLWIIDRVCKLLLG